MLPASLHDAAKFAEALRAGAEDVGASLGTARCRSRSASALRPSSRASRIRARVRRGRDGCKAANDRGRNRVEVYHEADESIVRRFTDINLISDLRAAIAENRLELNAQLIVPLGNHTGAPHFEILLRMVAENGEIVGPDHFMSAPTVTS